MNSTRVTKLALRFMNFLSTLLSHIQLDFNSVFNETVVQGLKWSEMKNVSVRGKCKW